MTKHYSAELAAIIREVITKRTARIEVKHPKGKDIFEYDDSSERRDQLMNAYRFAQSLLDKGIARFAADHINYPEGASFRITHQLFDGGRLIEPGERRLPK